MNGNICTVFKCKVCERTSNNGGCCLRSYTTEITDNGWENILVPTVCPLAHIDGANWKRNSGLAGENHPAEKKNTMEQTVQIKVNIPEGYEATGEYREVEVGDIYLDRYNMAKQMEDTDDSPFELRCIILKKKELVGWEEKF